MVLGIMLGFAGSGIGICPDKTGGTSQDHRSLADEVTTDEQLLTAQDVRLIVS